MTVTITFRTTDNSKWGAGKSSNLTATEVDLNFWALKDAIENFDIPDPITIQSVTVNGTKMSFVMSDASIIGPIQMPVLAFHYLGAWQPNFAYAVLDTFFVNGFGIFVVEVAHTSGDTFDPEIEVTGSPALLQIFGATGFTTEANLASLADVLIDSSVTEGDFLVYEINSGPNGVWVTKTAVEVAAIVGAALSLNGLSDVSADDPADGDIIVWSEDDGVWELQQLPRMLVQLTDVLIDSTLADADVLTWSDGQQKWVGAPAQSGASSLDQLTDVIITSPTTGQVLKYDGAHFVNASDDTGGGGGGGGGATMLVQLTDVDIDSSLVDGDVLTWNVDLQRWIASPVAAGSGGGAGSGSVTFAGDWSGFAGYDPGEAVQDAGLAWLCYNTVNPPPGSLVIEAAAVSTAINSGTSKTIDITTTGNNEIVLVFVALANGTSSSLNQVSSVTSNNLTFTKKADFPHTSSFYATDIECWYAVADDPLTSETITITLAGVMGFGGVAVCGIIGADPGAPFDVNASAETNSFGTSPGAGATTFSTDGSDDIVFFIEVTNDTPSYTAPTGFTQIGSVGDASGAGNFSYKEYVTPQSSITVTSAESTNNHNVATFALTFASTGNQHPADDRNHWLGGLGISDLLDVDVGSGAVDGDILVFREHSGGFAWVAEANSGGGGNPPATIADTGLSTWLHQNGATVADTGAGILITGAAGSGANLSGRIKAAPATPYVITTKIAGPAGAGSSFPHVALGWYDGSNKLHVIDNVLDTTNNRFHIEVTEWNSTTAFSAASSGAHTPICGPQVYLQIENDGTTIYFRYSLDGENFYLCFSVAKASGFLGGSGYSNIYFGVNNQETSGVILGTLMEYAET